LTESTILIVDDDAVMQLLIEHVLTMEGHTVHVAATGDEAVEIASRETPDLILLDLMLDRESGIEVAERLRAGAARDADIVVLSGREIAADDALLEKARVAGTIRKPFDPATLCTQIRALLPNRE